MPKPKSRPPSSTEAQARCGPAYRLLPASSQPSATMALKPRMATAMASTHMRMRVQSPMVTMSDTAPMVQKWVLLPTAPKMKARTNAPPVT